MIPPVVISVATAGIAEAERAFTSLGARIDQFERQAVRNSERASRQRVKGADDERKIREREYRKLFDDLDRKEKQATKTAEREARARTKADQQAAKASERATKEAAEIEIAARRKAAREAERLEEYKLRVQIRSADMASRALMRHLREEEAARARSARTWEARGKATGRFWGAQAASIGGAAETAIMGAGAAVTGIGGMMAISTARKEMQAQRSAALLVNAVTTGSAPPQGATVANILGQASQVSREFGLDKNDVVQMGLTYAQNARGGDFNGMMRNMRFFAQMGVTTGANMGEIAQTAAIMQSQNPEFGKDPAKMQQFMLDAYAQSKLGSMSMVDIARVAPTATTARSVFQGDEATNQRKLLGLAQIARGEVSSPEEAATAIKDMAEEAMKHAKDTGKRQGLKSMGVHFDKFGAIESPEQMISAVYKSTGGDITKIEDIFEKRGTALFMGMQKTFTQAGGGQAGQAAVLEQIGQVTGATMTPEQLTQQTAQIMEQSGARIDVAMQTVEQELAKKLAPALEHFAVDTLPKLEPAILGFVDALGDAAHFISSLTGTDSKSGTASVLEGANIEAKIKSGTATPDEVAQGKKLVGRMKEDAQNTGGFMDWLAKAVNFASTAQSPEDSAAPGTDVQAPTRDANDAIDAASRNLAKNLQTAADSLQRAIDKMPKDGPGASGGTPIVPQAPTVPIPQRPVQ